MMASGHGAGRSGGDAVYDPRNQFEPGTAEHFTKSMANMAEDRKAAEFDASGPMTFGRAALSLVFWGGLFAVGIFGSTGAFKTVGHILLIVCGVLLALAIAFVAYRFLVRPALKLTGWSWKRNALVRSVMVGAALGIGFGAWLGFSKHELWRGVARLGVMGTVLGLVVGMVLLMVAKASKRPAS